jgi:hypothetical protein
VDRVRRHEDVRRPPGECLAQHLVDVLEALLVLQIPETPERDSLVAAKAFERHAQEFRRAVDDRHSDLTVEDSQPQAVEEDPRPARVVDQDLARP